MNIISTETFKLAVLAEGDPNANKIAILTPGRLETKDYAHNVSHINFLASLGYYAISFDPPGTWDSPGDINLYTTTNCIRAVKELIQHFGNRQTLLMGHSRGGTISLLAGPQIEAVTDIISVNSNYGGASQLDRAKEGRVKVTYRDLPPGSSPTPEAESKRFDLPYGYFSDSDKYNALEGLSKCNKPKLFFYATQDNVVPPEDVRRMYNDSAEPKTIHELNSEHDYRFHPAIIDEVNQTVGIFLGS